MEDTARSNERAIVAIYHLIQITDTANKKRVQ